MRKHRITAILLLAALACAALLQGCASKNALPAGSAAPGTAGPAVTAAGNGAKAQPSAAAAATKSPMQAFGDDFKTVGENPLNESIRVALWLAAQHPEAAGPSGSTSALQAYVAQYQALVKDKGVHYVEITSAMGIDVATEYWIKGGKFKKVTALTDEAVIYDGEYYIKYDTAEKTGYRYSKDNELVQADAGIVLDGMLAKLAASPYKQQKDEKFGKFTCAVFYYDFQMDMMGMKMKGSWLYIDKATGMLVKNQTGDPKDKKNSSCTYVKSLAAGGFDDSVFAVPPGVKLEDY